MQQKQFLRGKFIATHSYLKKQEQSLIDNLTLQLKQLEKKNKQNEKFGLKPNIQKTKIMASGPITSWQIDGENTGNSG